MKLSPRIMNNRCHQSNIFPSFSHSPSKRWSSLLVLLAALGLASSLQAAPANDNFAYGTVISGSSVTVSGSNVGATKEVGEPPKANNNGGASVWWFWTAPASGSVTISTLGS